jgi:hypothetical protein
MERPSPLILIVIPICLLIGVGAISNNLVASGFQTVADSSTCTQIQCPAYQATACSINATTYCTLSSTTTYSFLSPTSPFTYLLSFDVLGFIGSFSSNPTQTPSSNLGVSSNCSPYANTGNPSMSDSYTGFLCQSLSWLNTKSFVSGYPPIEAISQTICKTYLSSWSGTCFNILSNENPTKGGWGNTCNAGGNGTEVFANWNVEGNITNPNNGLQTKELGQVQFFADYCDSSNPALPDFALTQFVVSTPSLGSTGTAPVLGFFGFLFGIILFIAGLSITFSGSLFSTGFTFGIGDQGAKLAQWLGVGAMAFGFVWSEFGGWLFSTTTGIAGFGIGVIMISIFGGFFFFGIAEGARSL